MQGNGTDTGGGLSAEEIGTIVGTVGGVVTAFLGLGAFLIYKFNQAIRDRQTSNIEFKATVRDKDGNSREIALKAEFTNDESMIIEQTSFDNRKQDTITEGVGALSEFVNNRFGVNSPATATHPQNTGVDNTIQEVTKAFADNNHLGDVEIGNMRNHVTRDFCNLALKLEQMHLAVETGIDPTDVRSLQTYRMREEQDSHAIKSPKANKNKKPVPVTVSDEDEDVSTAPTKKVKFVPKIIIQPQEDNDVPEIIEKKDNPKQVKKETQKEDIKQVEIRLKVDGVAIDPHSHKASEGKEGKQALQPPSSKAAKLKATTGSAPDNAPTTRVDEKQKSKPSVKTKEKHLTTQQDKPLIEKKVVEQQDNPLSLDDGDPAGGVQVTGDSGILIQITPEGQ